MNDQPVKIPREHLPQVKSMARRWAADHSAVVQDQIMVLGDTLPDSGLVAEFPALGEDPVAALQNMQLAIERGIMMEGVANMQALRRGLDVMEVMEKISDDHAGVRQHRVSRKSATRKFLREYPEMTEADLNPADVAEISEIHEKCRKLANGAQKDASETGNATMALMRLVDTLHAAQRGDRLPSSGQMPD